MKKYLFFLPFLTFYFLFLFFILWHEHFFVISQSVLVIMNYKVIFSLICIFFSVFFAEFAFAQSNNISPKNDLQKANLKGRVRYVVSYESMAVRSDNGVVFSEEPIKSVTYYNQFGYITRHETYRFGAIVETTSYSYNKQGQLAQKKITQGNGVISSIVRYDISPETNLCMQAFCYDFNGKLIQIIKYDYDQNENLVCQLDMNNYYSKQEKYLREYDERNQLVSEYDWRYKNRGNDSILYYHVDYRYNIVGDVAMQTHRFPKTFSGKVVYQQSILHNKYYQYDAFGNWRVCCVYFNAMADEKNLVPKSMIVREIYYY